MRKRSSTSGRPSRQTRRRKTATSTVGTVGSRGVLVIRIEGIRHVRSVLDGLRERFARGIQAAVEREMREMFRPLKPGQRNDSLRRSKPR